jgi:hypothetical protein
LKGTINLAAPAVATITRGGFDLSISQLNFAFLALQLDRDRDAALTDSNEASKYAVRQCSLWPATILVDCEFKVHHLAVSAFDLLGRSGGSRGDRFAVLVEPRRWRASPFSSARMTSTGGSLNKWLSAMAAFFVGLLQRLSLLSSALAEVSVSVLPGRRRIYQ